MLHWLDDWLTLTDRLHDVPVASPCRNSISTHPSSQSWLPGRQSKGRGSAHVGTTFLESLEECYAGSCPFDQWTDPNVGTTFLESLEECYGHSLVNNHNLHQQHHFPAHDIRAESQSERRHETRRLSTARVIWSPLPGCTVVKIQFSDSNKFHRRQAKSTLQHHHFLVFCTAYLNCNFHVLRQSSPQRRLR